MKAEEQEKYLELIQDFDTPKYPSDLYKYKNNLLNKSIYKYCNFETEYHLQALEQDFFWLSNADEFNDPYDCSLNFVNINGLLSDEEIPQEIRDEISVNIKNGYDLKDAIVNNLSYFKNRTKEEKRLCLEPIENAINQPFPHEENKKFRENFKIVCFSENHTNLLMWAHYAKSHTGFCVEYDVSQLEENNVFKRRLYPVIYTKTPLDLSLCRQSKRVDTAQVLLASNKSSDWSYESEWRYIGTRDDDNNFKIPVPPKTIYLGTKISPENETKITKLANTKNIPIKKMQLKPSAFKMEAIER